MSTIWKDKWIKEHNPCHVYKEAILNVDALTPAVPADIREWWTREQQLPLCKPSLSWIPNSQNQNWNKSVLVLPLSCGGTLFCRSRYPEWTIRTWKNMAFYTEDGVLLSANLWPSPMTPTAGDSIPLLFGVNSMLFLHKIKYLSVLVK